ncbi:MAG: hypothetical protein LQ350_007785 [Teloschistes chrysophthalmus]|nr:MAG: hypothetical protein LQ350_007785 [Niorma chrysophthalma]
MEEPHGSPCNPLPARESLRSDGPSSEWRQSSVHLDILKAAVRQLPQHKIDLTDVIEVLWAVVLREYVASDQVAFHRVVDGEDGASCLSINFVSYSSGSSSQDPCLASLIAARRDGVRDPFSVREGGDGNGCDTTVWISGRDTDEQRLPPPSSFDNDIVLEVPSGAVAGRRTATIWYCFPQIIDWGARNLASTLEQSMRCVFTACNTAIRDLDLLGPEHREVLRQRKLPQALPRTAPTTMPEILQKTAQAHPDVRSIEAWDGCWTYRELEETCRSLATYLHEIGIRPGNMVILLREKSKWTVAAMIATLMTGAVCVPVDIRQPKERIQRVIESTHARFVLTSEAMAQENEAWTQATPLRTICVPLSPSVPSQPSTGSPPTINPDSTAFVFFTSGSTGAPKGVVQEHLAVALTADQISQAMQMQSDTRTFQYSSYSFDVSVGDIFATFIAGGCLCVPSEDQRLNELPQTINGMEATHICITSTGLAGLTPKDVPSLRRVTVGGESLTREQMQAWLPRIATIYGTTESVIWDTYHAGFTLHDSPMNIGRAMGPTTAWIVDPWSAGKLVPMGAIGELLIGGPLLSRGYLDDKDRTEAAFLKNPSWLGEFLEEGEPRRVYRTGDLVRYNPDGTIQYLGRKDRQIKINGQRVELGDIEYALRQSFPDGTVCAAEIIHPDIRQSQETLAAFVGIPDLTTGSDSWSLTRVRNRIADLLPMYMIPSLFVPLQGGLPITSTGKIDRSKLRQMGYSLSAAQLLRDRDDHHPPRAPSTRNEQLVQRLCGEVLGVAAFKFIDMNSNFFQNGGTSIHAIRLVALAREHGFSLSVVQVFENPRLLHLAALLQSTTEGVDSKEATGDKVAPFSLLVSTLAQEDVQTIAASCCGVRYTQVQDVFPCTVLQEGLLALSSKELGDYIQQVVLEVPSMYNFEQFKQAYGRAAKRIPILRCRAFALPQANHQIHMAVIDESGQWFTDSVLDRCSDHDRQALSSCGLGGQLVKCSFVVDSTQKQWFVWTIHHALFDGWSLSLMLDEVERQLLGRTISPILPFQNFIQHLRNEVDFDACRSFWRSRLDGASKLHFPLALPLVYQPSGDVATVDRTICDVQWPATGVTPSAIVQGAWAALLSQCTASPDVVFGATVIGRHAATPKIEHIAGPTITTVPLRVHLQPGQLVSEYLQQLQLDVVRTVPYEQLGLAEIAKVSADAEKACGFQTLFVIQPPEEATDGPDAHLLERSQTKVMGVVRTFAVTIQCWLGSTGSAEFRMEADEKVLDRSEGERLLAQLEVILRRLCANTTRDTTLRTILPCNDADLAQISRWNATIPVPPSKTILDLLARQVAAHPDGTAVESWDGSLTYGQLDLQASQFALQLIPGEGGPKGGPIVICVEKSYLAIIAFVAVLRAGGACVFIDPTHSGHRLKAILSRSQARLAVTDEPRSRLLSPWITTITISSAILASSISTIVHAIPSCLPEDNACIVFTSGSTGEPKAICWNHQNLAAVALGLGAQLHLSSHSRVFQFSSYAFDVSIHEIAATLIHGGCVYVPSEIARQDALQQTIVSSQASAIILTPSVAQVLDPKHIPCLRTVVFCGEPLPVHIARNWSRSTAVHNWYGPAECSLATWCRIVDSWRAGGIGMGASTRTWLVHHQDHDILQPLGAVGELLLQGPCVASGYKSDSARTAKSFIDPPPWWQQCHPGVTGTRLYKTGDLARYAGDGSLILLGRKDTQVKIHGQRIELEEIQGKLQEVLGDDVAVIVDMIQSQACEGATTLAAFLQPTVPTYPREDDHAAPTVWTQTMQARLGESLPTWMVPANFFTVEKLPRTSTGKVDRRKLQTLGASWLMNSSTVANSVEDGGTWQPSTESETVLRGLCMEVLGLSPDQIGPNAHFIRLGGNSIDAMRLAAAATSIGYSLSVRDILATPSLTDLSRRIQRVTPEDSSVKQVVTTPFSLVSDAVTAASARNDAALQCYVQSDQIEDVFPCTALQTALLALACKKPGDYVSRNVYQIQGPLDRFKSSWEVVVAETPILRTRIIDLGAEDFYQAIIDEPVDWTDTGASPDDDLAAGQRLPMGLGTPLVHWEIIADRSGQTSSFTFVWTIHHSLFDGWSFRAILDRVERVYRKQPLVATTPFQGFCRYTMGLRATSAADDFWKQRLDDAVVPQFPICPSPQYQPRATCTIASGSTSYVNMNHRDYTWTTILRAAWSLVLARFSRSTDVVFGITVIGRQAPVLGVCDMIGPTIATVPFRVQWSEADTVQGLLQTVQTDGIEMIPFEQIGLQRLRRLGPGVEEVCRFQTMLIIQPFKEQGQKGSGLFNDFEGDQSVGVFSSTALMLRCSLASNSNEDDGVDSIRFHLDFDPFVVDEQQAQRILDQVDHTMSRLLSASSSTRVYDLQLLSSSDMEQILLWNGTIREPVDTTVTELFQNSVHKMPTAPAVHAWDASFSYEELDRYADNIAYRLLSLGLQGRQRVPLYFEKSAWTVVAIFGALKAGGTVVLLEPNQPDDRLHSILDRIDAPLILTSMQNADAAQRLLPLSPVVVVDASVKKSVTQPLKVLQPKIDSYCPVYVVFTSGSTGVPKGVVITHGNVCSALKYRQGILSYQRGDRVLDGVSYAFDVCWGNILFTLCSGACLCVPASVDAIGASLNQFRVSVAGTVPSVARLLDCQQYPTLETMLVGGESIHPGEMADWAQRVNVFNSYGPAECTISVCLALVDGEDRVHIGRGTGATLWIVDDTTANFSLASIGSIGELWLEGPQVGLGYLNDPDSTNAAFTENEPAWLSTLPATTSRKTSGQKKRRFYRTGDLAQYFSDGMVRLVGRRDTQAKLRGQRIELGEVEHYVKKHLPRGIEAVAEVIVLRSSSNRQFLVIFVVPDATRGLSHDDVQNLGHTAESKLSQALPSHMRPSAYIPLTMLPRLAAGKVNRGQLREIGAMLSIEELSQPLHRCTNTNRVKQPPETLVEKKLVKIWADTLGLAPSAIGAGDSFLQLDGGDSISVMRLVRLAQENGMRFSVADVFSHPTLRDLASRVTFRRPEHEAILPFSLWQGPWTVDRLRDEAAARCDVYPEQIEDIFPCTALQEGLLALTSKQTDLYTCREAFQLHEDIDAALLRETWDMVGTAMPILRTRVIDLYPHGLHQVVVNEPISWNSQDTRHPFALGSRLVYWSLIEEAQSKRLVWTIHHSLYDAVSMARIFEQVERAYYREPLRPCLSMQPFIRYLSTIEGDATREFWNAQLSEAPPPSFPALPSASYEAKATQSCTCHLASFQWPAAMDVTPSIWVRAAWALLIGTIMNVDSITFGATVSGRQLPVVGIQDIVGPTIATVPIRVQIDWTASIGDFGRQLQQQATDMIPFEQVGLHRLRHISEDAKQATQFRTLLNVAPGSSEPRTSRLWAREDNEPRGQFNDFACILDCELGKSGVMLQLDFDDEVMQPRQAQRLLHQLETVLLQLGHKSLDMTKPLADFNPISSRDLAEIWQWNAVVPDEVSVSLHDTIHHHVRQHPCALAVEAWDGQMTYEALDRYSTNLASHLQAEHREETGPGSVIALCFEKSMWTVVAALAVVKTGSAFTLMDSTYPEERLRSIASQVSHRLIVSSTSNASLAAKLAKYVVVVDHTNLSRYSPARPLRTCVSPTSTLYVVFTSGSTGTPKGAVITHANFSSAVKHQGAFLGYSPQTRVYDFASYGFDIAVSNMLHCLAAGGCLCIPSDAERKHSQLAESMKRMNINVVDLTPSVARTLDPTAIPSLKTLILGGEVALRSDILKWAPYVRVLNGIGQAECTVTTTMAVMDPTVAGTPGIGKALGTNTWIVSPTDHNQLVAIGAVGELLVEGPLVGAGYLKDEAKTAAAFIHDPRWLTFTRGSASKTRRGRLYKTGDLVRYDTDGSLCFIGRKDAQTKIRGQRIELEEVEYHVKSTLSSLSMEASVAAEALVLSATAIQSAMLVVFVCAATIVDSEEGSDAAVRVLAPDGFPSHYRQELQTRLENQLPSAMVPFVYVPVNRIPLSPTGKTDRKRLKALGASLTTENLAQLRGIENKPKRPPTTATEHQVRDLWAEILVTRPEKIGIDDNFVQLGGDSVSAIRLLSRSRDRGLVLDPKILLGSTSTLSDLASTASQASASAATEVPKPFSQLHMGDHTPSFLKRNIAPYIDRPISDIEDVFPVTDFQADCIRAAVHQGPPSSVNYFYTDFQHLRLHTDAIRSACQTLSLHLPILRTVFVPFDDTFLQVVTKDWTPDFLALESGTAARDIPATAEETARRDWMNADLDLGTRFAHFTLLRAADEPGRARLTIRLSHALYDATSLDLVFGTLAAAMEQKTPLPAIGSFAAFIRHCSRIRDDASRHWRKVLSGSSSWTETMTIPRSPGTNERGVVIGEGGSSTPYIVRLTAGPASPLPEAFTAATFYTACWAAVLASVTQNPAVVFGRLVSGRAAVPMAEVVAGPCLNVVPVRAVWDHGGSSSDNETDHHGHNKQKKQHNICNKMEKTTTPPFPSLFPPEEILASVQQQQVDGLAYESVGATMMNAPYGSVFQYQNIDEGFSVPVFGERVEIGVMAMAFRPRQLWMLVKPKGMGHGGSGGGAEEGVEVLLFGTSGIMDEAEARGLGERFCEIVEASR